MVVGPPQSGLTPRSYDFPQALFPCDSVSGEARFRVRRRRGKLRKGLGRWPGGGRGTCSPGRQRVSPQAVADGSSPRRFPCSRVAPNILCGRRGICVRLFRPGLRLPAHIPSRFRVLTSFGHTRVTAGVVSVRGPWSRQGAGL